MARRRCHESRFSLPVHTGWSRCHHGLRIGSDCAGKKSLPIGHNELIRDPGTQINGAETAEVEIEIRMHRFELAHVDALMAFLEAFGRPEAGRIVIAGDIKTAQRRGQVESREMVGREPGDHRQ